MIHRITKQIVFFVIVSFCFIGITIAQAKNNIHRNINQGNIFFSWGELKSQKAEKNICQDPDKMMFFIYSDYPDFVMMEGESMITPINSTLYVQYIYKHVFCLKQPDLNRGRRKTQSNNNENYIDITSYVASRNAGKIPEMTKIIEAMEAKVQEEIQQKLAFKKFNEQIIRKDSILSFSPMKNGFDTVVLLWEKLTPLKVDMGDCKAGNIIFVYSDISNFIMKDGENFVTPISTESFLNEIKKNVFCLKNPHPDFIVSSEAGKVNSSFEVASFLVGRNTEKLFEMSKLVEQKLKGESGYKENFIPKEISDPQLTPNEQVAKKQEGLKTEKNSAPEKAELTNKPEENKRPQEVSMSEKVQNNTEKNKEKTEDVNKSEKVNTSLQIKKIKPQQINNILCDNTKSTIIIYTDINNLTMNDKTGKVYPTSSSQVTDKIQKNIYCLDSSNPDFEATSSADGKPTRVATFVAGRSQGEISKIEKAISKITSSERQDNIPTQENLAKTETSSDRESVSIELSWQKLMPQKTTEHKCESTKTMIFIYSKISNFSMQDGKKVIYPISTTTFVGDIKKNVFCVENPIPDFIITSSNNGSDSETEIASFVVDKDREQLSAMAKLVEIEHQKIQRK